MEQIKQVIKQMIAVSEEELNEVLSQAITRNFKRQEVLSYLYLVLTCRPQVK